MSHEERQARFASLYEDHHADVCAYLARRCPRERVDDLAAEAFVVAWRRMPERTDQPLAWLYATARRVLANDLRRQARDRSLVERLAGRADRTAPDPFEAVDGDARLAAALRGLSPTAREALRLVAWEQLSPAEAARAAGCSRATFAVRLTRARRQLAARLDQDSTVGASENTIPEGKAA